MYIYYHTKMNNKITIYQSTIISICSTAKILWGVSIYIHNIRVSTILKQCFQTFKTIITKEFITIIITIVMYSSLTFTDKFISLKETKFRYIKECKNIFVNQIMFSNSKQYKFSMIKKAHISVCLLFVLPQKQITNDEGRSNLSSNFMHYNFFFPKILSNPDKKNSVHSFMYNVNIFFLSIGVLNCIEDPK